MLIIRPQAATGNKDVSFNHNVLSQTEVQTIMTKINTGFK